MEIKLDESDLEQFVHEQVASGRFRSPQQVVAHALAELRADMSEAARSNVERVKAMIRADEQIDRGEYLTLQQVREKFERDVFRK